MHQPNLKMNLTLNWPEGFRFSCTHCSTQRAVFWLISVISTLSLNCFQCVTYLYPMHCSICGWNTLHNMFIFGHFIWCEWYTYKYTNISKLLYKKCISCYALSWFLFAYHFHLVLLCVGPILLLCFLHFQFFTVLFFNIICLGHCEINLFLSFDHLYILWTFLDSQNA